MTQTDRILSNIGAIRTLLENFPMGLFERDGKTYTSSFEFIMDVLRSCGINDQKLITYVIGKIYGFEGQPGYTINGLYEMIKRGEIKVEMQNPFISALEEAIKGILMALFTSIFTCSALPILPNKVFDYDSLAFFMDYNVEAITRRSIQNDRDYKLKIPISTIDILGMLSISPTTSQGSLYYLTDGRDAYYKKTYSVIWDNVAQTQVVEAGDSYYTEIKKYKTEYLVRFVYAFPYASFDIYSYDVEHGTGPTQAQCPIDMTIKVNYLYGDSDAPCDATFVILSGQVGSESVYLESRRRHGDDYYKTKINGITINGNKQCCEIGSDVENMSWCYLTTTNFSILNWEDEVTGGEPIKDSIFGRSMSGETITISKVAEVTDTYNCVVEVSSSTLSYKEIQRPNNYEVKTAIRYAYVPEYLDDDSPEYIVCFHGENPNLIYRSYDMNAFLWYCYNRCNVSNQVEQNHLMWDSRLSASKNGVKRDGGAEWNRWYSSKAEEGDEFEYNSNPSSEVIYPIIQVEKYSENDFLVRIPAQRYFAPKKREEIYDGTFEPGGMYFNASVYRFDWEYLKNIQILNPKLMLIRLIENLIGFSMSLASNVQFNVNQKRIEAVLSKAVKSIITANDMEVEDCWKSFSNEDYNDLLNEMLLSRYKATETNGESSKIRRHDTQDYINQLDQINSSVESHGTNTMITKTVTNVMMTKGTEESTGYSFEFGFDSNMLSKLIWAVVMPIVESLFTPQVMMLMVINFQLLGVTNIDDVMGNDFGKVLNLLLNKILGLVKSIVLFIKDKILSLLLDLFNQIITPILTNMMLMLYLEMITDWLVILLNAVKCIPFMLGLNRNKPIGYIEDVDYADIVNDQNIPESSSEC